MLSYERASGLTMISGQASNNSSSVRYPNSRRKNASGGMHRWPPSAPIDKSTKPRASTPASFPCSKRSRKASRNRLSVISAERLCQAELASRYSNTGHILPRKLAMSGMRSSHCPPGTLWLPSCWASAARGVLPGQEIWTCSLTWVLSVYSTSRAVMASGRLFSRMLTAFSEREMTA